MRWHASLDKTPHPNQFSTFLLCRPVFRSGDTFLQWSWTRVALFTKNWNKVGL
jgi:hypothetical protein